MKGSACAHRVLIDLLGAYTESQSNDNNIRSLVCSLKPSFLSRSHQASNYPTSRVSEHNILPLYTPRCLSTSISASISACTAAVICMTANSLSSSSSVHTDGLSSEHRPHQGCWLTFVVSCCRQISQFTQTVLFCQEVSSQPSGERMLVLFWLVELCSVVTSEGMLLPGVSSREIYVQEGVQAAHVLYTGRPSPVTALTLSLLW